MRRWWALVRRARQVRPAVADAALAALVGALGLAQLATAPAAGSSARPPDAGGYLLVLAISAPLALRRRHPRGMLALVLAATAVLSVAGYSQTAVGIPFIVAVYSVGAHCALREAAWVLAAVPVVVLGVSLATSPVPVTVADVAQVSVFGLGAWWLGASVRLRREDAARQAVTTERLRIARELHDVVAHSMSVVAVQSGVAAHVLDENPGQARAALEAISVSSRTAMAELRRLLDVLRPDGEAAGSGLTPAPGLADLDALLAQVRAAGVAVTVQGDGSGPGLPPGADLTAYRVVQEALTNTVKHAGPGATATVSLSRRGEELRIDVVDDGNGVPVPPRLGVSAGLVGMRERVALFGGSLEVGPVPGGGWRVHAVLPLRGRSQ